MKKALRRLFCCMPKRLLRLFSACPQSKNTLTSQRLFTIINFDTILS